MRPSTPYIGMRRPTEISTSSHYLLSIGSERIIQAATDVLATTVRL